MSLLIIYTIFTLLQDPSGWPAKRNYYVLIFLLKMCSSVKLKPVGNEPRIKSRLF